MRRVLAGWVLAWVGTVGALAQDPPRCARVGLEGATPRWSFDGEWDAEGTILSLVDVTGGRVLRYDLDGKLVATVARPGQGRLEFDHPTGLTLFEGRYLMGQGGDRWLWLDAAFEPVAGFGQSEMTASFPGGKEPLQVGISELSIVGGKGLAYAVGPLVGGGYYAGWVTVGLDSGQVESFVEEPPDRAHVEVHSLTGASQASTGETLYQLRWGSPTRIRRISPGLGRDLAAFPERFRAYPDLPANRGPASSVARFRALEKARLAAGLFARNGSLYLLTREPEGEATRWEVHGIDPLEDRLTGAVRLPTDAAHIFLVPGPRYWAVVEKASVVVGGEQTVEGVLLVPSSSIEGQVEGQMGTAAEARAETIDCS